MREAKEKYDLSLKDDLSKSVISSLRHHNDETAYNQWYREQETLALNREASIVNEQYEKHVKKREIRQKAMVNKDRLDLLRRRREEEAEARKQQDADYLSSDMPMQAPEGSVVHRVKVKKVKQAEKQIATEAQMTLKAILAKEDLIEYFDLLQAHVNRIPLPLSLTPSVPIYCTSFFFFFSFFLTYLWWNFLCPTWTHTQGCNKAVDIGKYSEQELLDMSDKIVHRRKLLALRNKFMDKVKK